MVLPEDGEAPRRPPRERLRCAGHVRPAEHEDRGEEAERRAIARAREPQVQRKEVPTFKEWFRGRFWREWVVGHRNKPSEIESKESIFKHHLEPFFGATALDRIGQAEIAQFRAS